MIRTIIFDLGEVYLHGMKDIETDLEKLLGVKIPHKLYLEKEAELFFHGQISEQNFWKKIIDRYKLMIDVATLKNIIRGKMTEIEGTRVIIEALKKQGYLLGLLSVHGKEWVEYCEGTFDYHKLFHSVMYSFEVQVSKPDPRSFKLILAKLGAQPEECLFIDDHSVNIEAAEKLGIRGICFERSNQLRNELLRYQIII